MNAILLVLLGVLLGAVIGWLLAASRTRAELVKSQVDAEGRVKAAEGTLQEVRARLSTLQATLDGRERELGGLQQKLREESEQKVKAQTELENARIAAEDSRPIAGATKGGRRIARRRGNESARVAGEPGRTEENSG